MEEPQKTGNNGQFQKGNPGRAAGTQNRLTKTVKETVLAVFNEIQSDPKINLKAFAAKYPRDFYNIAARLIPTEVSGSIVTSFVINEVLSPGNEPVTEDAKAN